MDLEESHPDARSERQGGRSGDYRKSEVPPRGRDGLDREHDVLDVEPEMLDDPW